MNAPGPCPHKNTVPAPNGYTYCRDCLSLWIKGTVRAPEPEVTNRAKPDLKGNVISNRGVEELF